MLKKKYNFYSQTKALEMDYTSKYMLYRISEDVNYFIDYGNKEDLIIALADTDFPYIDNIEDMEQISIKPIPYSKNLLTSEAQLMVEKYLKGNDISEELILYNLRHILKNEKAHRNFANLYKLRENFVNFKNLDEFVKTLF